MIPVTALVVAKAPVPGLAKTRLAETVGEQAAVAIAAAALLDTLDAVVAAPVTARVVALTGNLDDGCATDALRERLDAFTVVDQRGDSFADRLANAHADAAAAAGQGRVLQIGMDTPQVTAELLAGCAERLLTTDAVLGMAHDGGWWVLGFADASVADCLRAVPMSQPDTGALTLKALRGAGLDVQQVVELGDFDTADDADDIRGECPPDSRFIRALRSVAI